MQRIKIFLITMVMLPAFCQGQLSIGLEYFWDVDPGMGQGIFVAFDSPSELETIDIDLATSSLTPGKHVLYIRAKKENGNFGPIRSKTFYIEREVVAAEYFLDTDPGFGNGIPLDLVAVSSFTEVCDKWSTADLAAGVHQLYVRTKSDDGKWSHPLRYEITIEENSTPAGCTGDFDLSGFINTTDLLMFLPALGETNECAYDLTGDLVVNTSDILIFLAVFGTLCE